jgi:thioredoxin reductase (NADPH)
VVGGGNSAGQAAVFFSNYDAEVIMLLRGAGLALGMSRYLIAQIAEKGNIRIEAWTEVTGVHGEEHLEQIVTTTRDPDGGRISITRDAKGYIYTGRDLTGWPLDREPFPLETSLPGIFCAGDVRHSSIKRVASGVGEGSMSIAFIHEYLALTGSRPHTRVKFSDFNVNEEIECALTKEKSCRPFVAYPRGTAPVAAGESPSSS